MALEDDMAVLARVSLFTTLGEEQLRLIAFGAEAINLPAGRLVCRNGEPADGSFVLMAGSLSRLDDNLKEVERTYTEAGTLIGELSLFTACNWHSTIMTDTHCRLLRLPRALFRRILDEYPQTAADMQERLTADLSAKVRLMEAVAKKVS